LVVQFSGSTIGTGGVGPPSGVRGFPRYPEGWQEDQEGLTGEKSKYETRVPIARMTTAPLSPGQVVHQSAAGRSSCPVVACSSVGTFLPQYAWLAIGFLRELPKGCVLRGSKSQEACLPAGPPPRAHCRLGTCSGGGFPTLQRRVPALASCRDRP